MNARAGWEERSVVKDAGTIMDLADEMQLLADQIKKSRRTPDYLKTWPSTFVGPPRPVVVNTPTVAEYREALAAHDWYYHQSDDPTAYRAGRDSFEHILHLQTLLDPKRVVWKEYSPFARSA